MVFRNLTFHSSILNNFKSIILLSCVLLGRVAIADAAPSSVFDTDIASADIEQLMDIKVTSVSKVPEALGKAPAAVTVLTSEDIRRSGARSIPELLRRVPGVEVARIDANKWAVSIRGFNSRLANKLLVMVDGRSIYNPLYSGTLWETKDLPLESIERIEVIRGPGGSAWGSNAVNGVINIITKSAKDTLGGLIVAGGGTEERAFSNARYGVKLTEDDYLRGFGKTYFRDAGHLPGNERDESQRGQGGFRYDHVEEVNTFTLQGSYDAGHHYGTNALTDIESEDKVLQGQWQRTYEDKSSLLVNGYYAETNFDSLALSEQRETGELNVQYTFNPLEGLELTPGLQYRLTNDKITDLGLIRVDPLQRDDSLFSAFLQARITLIPETLMLKTGARVERNDYSDFEVQPDVALSWTPTEDDLVWGSIARAVRIPSRLENDLFLKIPQTGFTIVGNRNLGAENLISYQAGYRKTFSSSFIIDAAVFYNNYKDLIINEGNTLLNSARGHSYGFELAPTWKPTKNWKSSIGYSFLMNDFSLRNGSTADAGTAIGSLEGNDPKNQMFFSNSFDLSSEWSLDFTLRFVDRLRQPAVSRYMVGDIRVGWEVRKDLELAVVGQNLFNGHHFEQGGTDASEVQQGVYGQVTWTF